jgi:hypothetical protein
MKIANVANFIKTFSAFFKCYQHIALSFDLSYAARSVNYN